MERVEGGARGLMQRLREANAENSIPVRVTDELEEEVKGLKRGLEREKGEKRRAEDDVARGKMLLLRMEAAFEGAKKEYIELKEEKENGQDA